MANELKHGSVGTELTQAEWEAVGTHVVANQAVGDIIYASTTAQLSRLAKGTDTHVLILSSGIPAWSATTGITTVGTIATGVWQGTDVGVAYGGTGVSTLTDGGVLLGSGASAITAMAVLTDGQMIVGDGTGDPVAESGATLRTSIGVGTGDTLSLTGLTLSTDLTVANGGTGVSTLTSNGVLIGNGASAIASVDMSTKGHVLIGDGSGNPQMLGVGTNNHVMTADSGETTGVKWAAPAAAAAGSLTGSTLASGVTASSLTSVGTLTALTVSGAVINYDDQGVYLGTGSDSRIYYDGTDTIWNLRNAGTGDLMIALEASFPSPDPQAVHIWAGSAGSVDAASPAILILEDNGVSGMQLLVPNDAQSYIWFGDADASGIGFIEYDHVKDQMSFRTADDYRFRISKEGIIRIGGSAAGPDHATTVGTNLLSIYNGTAPVGTLTNGASLYVASGEMNVIDAAGNVTLLSPHDDDGNWIFRSKDNQGRVLQIHMEKFMRRLEEKFGWGLIEEFMEAT